MNHASHGCLYFKGLSDGDMSSRSDIRIISGPVNPKRFMVCLLSEPTLFMMVRREVGQSCLSGLSGGGYHLIRLTRHSQLSESSLVATADR